MQDNEECKDTERMPRRDSPGKVAIILLVAIYFSNAVFLSVFQ